MDFSGQDLRGRNFRGQDLTGANFSHADIRGANFSNAILRGANFTGAKAGLQKRWIVGQLLLIFLLSALTGILQGYFSFVITYYFPRWWDSTYDWSGFTSDLTYTVTYFIIIIAMFAAIARQGFTARALATIGIAVAVAGAGAGAVAGALLGIYVAWRSLKGDEKFALIRTIGVAFGAIGGTSLCGADLTDADFAKAILKGTNFNHTKQKRTILHQVCWSGAMKLDRARLGTSILADPAVRELLITRNGYKKSYRNADLYNANLKGVNLEGANLEQANLSHATLQQANLKDAILTKTLAVGTDFRQAYLTRACLESWNIDHTTTLDRVDCQFVFLLEQPNKFGSRERRPHDSDKVFQPGDFEKLYTKIMTTVQLLLRNGVNPEAFAVAFQKLMQENPDISPDSVQAIEKKGTDVLVTLQLPEGTDKGKVEHTFDTAYQAKLEAQKNAELLESAKRHNQELNQLALTLAQNTNLGNLLSNLTIVAGNENTMTDNKNQGINAGAGSFVNTGTNQMTNSILNMSGAVTNALNQLPDTKTEQPGIKELLTQLQTAIEADPELSEKGKTNALEQVKTLAEVGQNPDQPEKKSLGEKAMTFLKGTIANLPDTAKLAEACSKLLPLIAKALGLPI